MALITTDSRAQRILKPLLIGFLTLSFLVNGTILWKRLPTLGYGDFIIFYTGAQIVSDGNAAKLYDLDVQSKYQQKLGFVSFLNPGGILPFNHPAYELLPFLPFIHLSFKSAYILWAVLNIVLILLAWRLLVPYFPSKHRLVLSTIVLTFSPAWIAALRGQDSVISVLLFIGVFLCLKSGRDLAAGGLLGLGLYKPQLVLPTAILLIVKRRWISLQALVATGIALMLLSATMTGWDGVIGYVKLLSWINRVHYAIYPEHMANVHGFVDAVIGLSHPGTVSNLVIAITSVALYLWCLGLWRGRWEPTGALFDLRFSHLVLITLLVSYHAYAYDLILLLLVFVLSLRYTSIERSESPAFRIHLLVLSIVFCFPPILHLMDDTKEMAWVALCIFISAVIISTEICAAERKTGNVCLYRLPPCSLE
jgi:hypothetical protein